MVIVLVLMVVSRPGYRSQLGLKQFGFGLLDFNWSWTRESSDSLVATLRS
jgi:hypothetical protein